jgi:hypothetical protein
MLWETIQTWFLNLGAQYGVNPILFGSIYVGAIPFFTLSVAWLVRNVRRGRSIVLPTLTASFFFVSAYLYLLVAGRNIPAWVYVFVAVMMAYGIYATAQKVRRQVAETDAS